MEGTGVARPTAPLIPWPSDRIFRAAMFLTVFPSLGSCVYVNTFPLPDARLRCGCGACGVGQPNR